MTAKAMQSTGTADGKVGSNLSKAHLNRKLMHACMNRDVTMAKQALLQGANANCRTSSNITPLLVAAEHGDVDLIVLLCTQPSCVVDLQERTLYGSTPLHLSALFGHRKAMLELLKRGAVTNCYDNLGRYPLHFSATHKDVEGARILIKFGARVNVYDAFAESPLYYSVIRRPCIAMARLLLANRASSDPPPESLCMGLLLEAVLSVRLNSDFEAIKVLIWFGGNVNVADPVAWRTPLHLVAINGRLELADKPYTLAVGLNLHLPIMQRSIKYDIFKDEPVRYLIRHGADLYAKDRAGQTPLEVAYNYHNLKIAHLIEESRDMQATSYTSQILESTEGSYAMRNHVR